MDADINSPSDLFVQVYRLWPHEIDLGGYSEGKPIWPLVKIVEDLQEQSEKFGDLIEASIWPFHQALFDLAIASINEGRSVVYPRDVSLMEFQRNLETALDDPSWRSARAIYKRLAE